VGGNEQEKLVGAAHKIESRCVYNVTPKEQKAIREGLAELDRGEWTSEEAMRAFWVRCGIL
jgi:predicted transcriptional regulator